MVPREKSSIKLYRPQGLNPVVVQMAVLPVLPFENPFGFVPTAGRGGYPVKYYKELRGTFMEAQSHKKAYPGPVDHHGKTG